VKEAFFAAKEKPKYKKIVDFYGTRPGCREWLLDTVWYVENKGGLVAVESELGYHVEGIKFDFSKLLSFKAPLKIMIVDTGRREPAKLLQAIEEYARSFRQHQPGEVYYLIDFHNSRHDVYRYTTGRHCTNGRATAFTFKHLLQLSGNDA